MNISQAARQSGLSAKQIRDYEKSGLITPPPRGSNGYRSYREEDVARLRFIFQARQVGFSLADIQSLLALSDNPGRSSRAVKLLTGQHIDRLRGEIAKMQAMLALLEGWYDACAGDQNPACPILNGLNRPCALRAEGDGDMYSHLK
ncbi:MerR family transcriptional regulator [Bergeriella denitrificans]|uniref:MerR family transcriptional regulator n=1 Tax=Bergeriella denitrificans TaxID=494 RepID=A0A378UGQ0_BERDE|nr:MerR family transcriptional regulator [Bergeriella denitrificans]STZ76485.1 MerR family transcriptional regulator [Bergeriella denitrificans]